MVRPKLFASSHRAGAVPFPSMIFRSTVATVLASTICLVLLVWPSVSAQQLDGTALRDIQVGMEGLMEASKDPMILAQLMKDMQVRTMFCDDRSQ